MCHRTLFTNIINHLNYKLGDSFNFGLCSIIWILCFFAIAIIMHT